MKPRAFRRIAAVSSVLVCAFAAALSIHGAPRQLPDHLSDREFWQLINQTSEPNGYFRSDNLLSNEIGFPYLINELLKSPPSGRVYLGVGPEQNFNYIAALHPRMAFVIDIRRGNLDLQLMYKAIFELASDRADFIARLFSRQRPAGLTKNTTTADIFTAFTDAQSSEAVYTQNLKTILDYLTKHHHFDLSPDDRSGIEYVYRNFRMFGPAIRYSSSQGGLGGGFQPSYAELMLAGDADGEMRSFLTSEENFSVLRDLERKNLIVPVVGNFAGPKAIRAVGAWLGQYDATVAAFYLSNVEQFLGSTYQDFCGNVSSLPIDDSSTFIRSVRGGRFGPKFAGLNLELGLVAPELRACVSSAR
jgi:hypothetical protein